MFDPALREIGGIVDARLLPEQAAEIGRADVQVPCHAVERDSLRAVLVDIPYRALDQRIARAPCLAQEELPLQQPLQLAPQRPLVLQAVKRLIIRDVIEHRLLAQSPVFRQGIADREHNFLKDLLVIPLRMRSLPRQFLHRLGGRSFNSVVVAHLHRALQRVQLAVVASRYLNLVSVIGVSELVLQEVFAQFQGLIRRSVGRV